MFSCIESRGRDASGFWGVSKDNGKILYHKEPITSSVFVKGEFWKKISKMNPDILLTHARGASTGVGSPFVNANNHPFVNSDRSIGLIHNGRVSDSQYKTLKNKYEVSSGCDSEILLRIFEHAHLNSNKNDTSGFANIWSQVLEAHMAIAVGEKTSKNERRLWITRNKHRPNWVVDLRKQLGQLFFVSTPEIWAEALNKAPSLKKIIKNNVKMVELPTEEIWRFKLTNDSKIILNKFKVEFEGLEEWEHKGVPISIFENPIKDDIYTNLDDSDNVIENHFTSTPLQSENLYYNEIYSDKENLDKVCENVRSIKSMLEDIETISENKMYEGSMTESEMHDLIYALESTEADLNGTLRILKQ